MQAPFSGEIDHVALWDRALTPQEIAALSGGEEHVARRDLEILGPPQQNLQYWRPRGKAYAGDCMVTCKDGEFHLFYISTTGCTTPPSGDSAPSSTVTFRRPT